MVAQSSYYTRINGFLSPMVTASASRCLTITYKMDPRQTLVIQARDSKYVATTLRTLSAPIQLGYTIENLKSGSGLGSGSGSGTGSGFGG